METRDHTNPIVNVSSHLKRMAAAQPFKRAVVYPVSRDSNGRSAYAHLTFLELDQESDRTAHGLVRAGILRGTRTILMVRPGPDFFVLTFALFKIGAVPVVVDPGMGIKRMLACLSQSRSEAFIGVPLAHMLRVFQPKFFSTVKTWVTVGRRWFWGGHSLKHFQDSPFQPFSPVQSRKNDTAAILFTTGSTGPAKGAVYTHGAFDAQVRQIRDHFNISTEDIDLPTFPLFALFDPALGMTAVIPDMDPTKPAQVNPENIIEPILDQGVTNMFASPALLNRVGRFGKENGLKLPSLKRVVSAGAPVSPSNIEQFSTMLNRNSEIHTPYGATEAVPIISIGSKEILSETKSLTEQGYGTCIGRPLNQTEIHIIRIDDAPIKKWSDDLLVPDGEIGEIVARGDLVSADYFERPDANALSKIRKNGVVYHRMGDLGWKDTKGRIWFCGRKSHRVISRTETYYTIPCESIFNTHPSVFRSALVGIGQKPDQEPLICIELEPKGKRIKKKQLKKELLALARSHPHTRNIEKILFHKGFPVDIRHNSKIFREKLAVWAEKQSA